MKVRPNPYVRGELLDLAEMAGRFAQERVKPGHLKAAHEKIISRDRLLEQISLERY